MYRSRGSSRGRLDGVSELVEYVAGRDKGEVIKVGLG